MGHPRGWTIRLSCFDLPRGAGLGRSVLLLHSPRPGPLLALRPKSFVYTPATRVAGVPNVNTWNRLGPIRFRACLLPLRRVIALGRRRPQVDEGGIAVSLPGGRRPWWLSPTCVLCCWGRPARRRSFPRSLGTPVSALAGNPLPCVLLRRRCSSPAAARRACRVLSPPAGRGAALQAVLA